MTNQVEILKMEVEYKTIFSCIDLYAIVNSEDKKRLVKILSQYDQVINHKKELQPQIDKINNYLKVLKKNISQEKLTQ